MKLYEVSKTKQRQWKSDLQELDNEGKEPFQQVKRRRLSENDSDSDWRFTNQVQRCGYVNSNGVPCKRAGVCPFHAEGIEYIRGVMRKKHDRDIDLLVLAASTLERNELLNKGTPKKKTTISSSNSSSSSPSDKEQSQAQA